MNLAKDEIEELIEEKIQQGIEKYGKSFKLYAIELISLTKALNNEVPPQQSRIIPLSEWDKFYPYPTVAALRQYYFKRKTNGFSNVVEYGGNNNGRILLDEVKVFDWLRLKKKVS